MVGKKILHYNIVEKIGQGGMGVVYLAEDTRLKRQVAIKFLPEHLAHTSAEFKRFESEAQAAAALNHPNIATIYAIEETEGSPQSQKHLFLVMEYIKGKELQKSLITSNQQSIEYAIQIARGLQAAHKKNVVHRDIKSANIMISDTNEVKIMDFGLAVCHDAVHSLSTDRTAGTLAYMSPEQLLGEHADHRSDIWSFGVVLFEMLSGELPFKGDYEQALIFNITHEEPEPLHKIPAELTPVIKKLLDKDPATRYQSMDEVITDLTHLDHPPKKKRDRPSIAVLPFDDMSPAKDQDYFCEGVAEEILNSLTRIDNLHVVSRTSSFLIKKEGKDVREIGTFLNVQSVLEGSVRKAGNKIRVNVQLTNVEDGFYLWSRRYDRELDDIFAIQDDIAENVATELRGVLSSEEKEAIRHSETTIAAYELFLRGRKYLNQLILETAREFFEKSYETDPNYVPCMAGLAEVHCWSYEWQGSHIEDLEAAYRYSNRALKMGPQYAESHVSHGYVLSLDNKYEEAEKEFKEAIQLNSKSFDAYYLYARSSFALGEIEKSTELFKKASEVNREDYQSLFLLAQSYKLLGMEKESMENYKRGLERAEYQLKIDPNNVRILSLGTGAVYYLGNREKAYQWIYKALELSPENQSVLTNYACLLAVDGKKEEAIDVLEKLYQKGFGKKDWISNDPDYETLRDHPRFIELLKKLK